MSNSFLIYEVKVNTVLNTFQKMVLYKCNRAVYRLARADSSVL